MCGRYTLYEIDELPAQFRVDDEAETKQLAGGLKKRYNIGPSQIEPTIIQREDERHMELMRWGFMSRWAKDTKSIFKYKTFNARSEEIFNKPTWKNAIRHTRCLVPSNGFYEWKDTPTGKQPYFIRPREQELFAFTGVYGLWKDAEDMEWGTFSIITTEPNKEMAAIHNRMPVILRPDDETEWLEESTYESGPIAALLRPYPDGVLEIHEVSRDVNTTRVDEERLVAPLRAR